MSDVEAVVAYIRRPRTLFSPPISVEARAASLEARITDGGCSSGDGSRLDVEAQIERRETRASRPESGRGVRVEREHDFDQIGGDEPSHHFVLAFGNVRRTRREPLAGHV